jgi:hypothetical protein
MLKIQEVTREWGLHLAAVNHRILNLPADVPSRAASPPSAAKFGFGAGATAAAAAAAAAAAVAAASPGELTSVGVLGAIKVQFHCMKPCKTLHLYLFKTPHIQ